MALRLILNADDFGLTEGINHAVEELYQAKALTSATLMAGGPAFEGAIEVAKRNPGLGVGCHLVFVDGRPVAELASIPSLLGAGGSFRTSFPDFVLAVLRGAIRQEDIGREAEAQIRRIQAAGIRVSHVDSHKHTHLLPAVAQPVIEAALRCGVQAFRNPFEPRWSRDAVRGRVPLRRRIEQSTLDLFRPGYSETTLHLTAGRTAGAATTSGTLGIGATGTLEKQTLRLLVDAALRNGGDHTYELCCHPGYDDADLRRQSTRLRASREVELHSLLAVIPGILRSGEAISFIQYADLDN